MITSLAALISEVKLPPESLKSEYAITAQPKVNREINILSFKSALIDFI